jgi:hypothetical protein
MRAGFLPRRLRVRVPHGRLVIASSFSGRTLGSDPSNGRSNRPGAAITTRRNRMRGRFLSGRLQVRVLSW